MNDLIHKIMNVIDHERYKVIGIITAVVLVLFMNGCSLEFKSALTGKQVTPAQWQAEKVDAISDVNQAFAMVKEKKIRYEAELAGDVEKINAKAIALNHKIEAGDADLQAKIDQRQKFFELAGGLGQTLLTGSVDPVSIYGTLASLIGIGLGVGGIADGARKNTVITQLKATTKSTSNSTGT